MIFRVASESDKSDQSSEQSQQPGEQVSRRAKQASSKQAIVCLKIATYAVLLLEL